MNRDLFLAILAMDSYNRGYGEKLSELFTPEFLNGAPTSDIFLGNARIIASGDSTTAINAGFYAVAYDWNGETIISYRGTDGLNDITQGWTVAAGWTDQAQANLAVEFYNAATGRDAFDVEIPDNVTLTGHSLGGGLAGFVSMLSGAPIDAHGHGRIADLAVAASNDNGAWRLAMFIVDGSVWSVAA